jgi:hypothetical protein
MIVTAQQLIEGRSTSAMRFCLAQEQAELRFRKGEPLTARRLVESVRRGFSTTDPMRRQRWCKAADQPEVFSITALVTQERNRMGNARAAVTYHQLVVDT